MVPRSRARRRLAAAGLLALAGSLAAAPAAAAPALAAGTSTSAADENWLMSAHQSNLAEVASGRDAQRYAQDGDVRNMGEDLVDDHRKLDETVSDLARKYDVFLPPLPTEAQRRAITELQNREGDAYDVAWVRHEVAAHRAMKAAAEKAVAEGEAADVVAAARDAGVVYDRHLDDLAVLARDLGIGQQPEEVTGGTGGQAAAAAAAATTRPAALLTALGVLLIGAGVVTSARRRRAAVTATPTAGSAGDAGGGA